MENDPSPGVLERCIKACEGAKQQLEFLAGSQSATQVQANSLYSHYSKSLEKILTELDGLKPLWNRIDNDQKRRIAELEQNLKQQTDELRSRDSEITSLTETLSSKGTDIASLTQALSDVRDELARLKEELKTSEDTKTNLENEVNANKQATKELQRQLNEQSQANNEASTKLQEELKTADDLRKQLSEQSQSNEETSTKLQEELNTTNGLRKQLSEQLQSNKETSTKLEEALESVEELQTLRNDYATLQTQQQDQAATLSAKSQEINNLSSELTQARSVADSGKLQLVEKDDKIKDLTADLGAATTKADHFSDLWSDSQNQLTSVSQALTSKTSECDAATEAAKMERREKKTVTDMLFAKGQELKKVKEETVAKATFDEVQMRLDEAGHNFDEMRTRKDEENKNLRAEIEALQSRMQTMHEEVQDLRQRNNEHEAALVEVDDALREAKRVPDLERELRTLRQENLTSSAQKDTFIEEMGMDPRSAHTAWNTVARQALAHRDFEHARDLVDAESRGQIVGQERADDDLVKQVRDLEEEIEEARAEAERATFIAADEFQKELDKALAEPEELRRRHDTELRTMRQDREDEVRSVRKDRDDQVARLREENRRLAADREDEIRSVRKDRDDQVARLREENRRLGADRDQQSQQLQLLQEVASGVRGMNQTVSSLTQGLSRAHIDDSGMPSPDKSVFTFRVDAPTTSPAPQFLETGTAGPSTIMERSLQVPQPEFEDSSMTDLLMNEPEGPKRFRAPEAASPVKRRKSTTDTPTGLMTSTPGSQSHLHLPIAKPPALQTSGMVSAVDDTVMEGASAHAGGLQQREMVQGSAVTKGKGRAQPSDLPHDDGDSSSQINVGDSGNMDLGDDDYGDETAGFEPYMPIDPMLTQPDVIAHSDVTQGAGLGADIGDAGATGAVGAVGADIGADVGADVVATGAAGPGPGPGAHAQTQQTTNPSTSANPALTLALPQTAPTGTAPVPSAQADLAVLTNILQGGADNLDSTERCRLLKGLFFVDWDMSAEEMQKFDAQLARNFSRGKTLKEKIMTVDVHAFGPFGQPGPTPGVCLWGSLLHGTTGPGGSKMTCNNCKFCNARSNRQTSFCAWADAIRGVQSAFPDRDATLKIPKRNESSKAATLDDWEFPQTNFTINVNGQEVRWILKKRKAARLDVDDPMTLSGPLNLN